MRLISIAGRFFLGANGQGFGNDVDGSPKAFFPAWVFGGHTI
jgi:hypothetical protein